MLFHPGPLEGKEIGGYRIEEKIGEGGMGDVYLAEQIRLRRKVAFKALKVGHSKAVEEFHHEAISAAQITHPNIVQVFDIAVDQGITFITMEYVDGVTLEEIMYRRGRFQSDTAVEIVVQVLQALARAHREGIVHRDIKPGNIMLDREGNVKVTDFGLARMLVADASSAHEKRRGTRLYMAPEQIRTPDVDGRADLYALGATFFHLLTGRPPFQAQDPRELLEKVRNDPVPDPRGLVAEVPEQLARIVMQLLAKEPEDRFPDAAAVLKDLGGQGVKWGEARAFESDEWRRAFRDAYRASGGLSRHKELQAPKSSLPLLGFLILAASFVAVGGAMVLMSRDAAEQQSGASGNENTVVGPTVSPEEEARLRRIKALFEFAKNYESDNPSNFKEIINNYEQVRKDGRGTKYRLMATAAILATRKRRVEQAEIGFADLKKELDKLAAGLQFRNASEKLDTWVAEHKGLGFEDRAKAVRRQINGRAGAEAKGRMAKVTAAIEDEDFGRARRLLNELRGFGVPKAIELAGEGEAALSKALKDAETRWAVEAVARQVEILRDVYNATTWRRYQEALEVIAKAMRDSKLKSIRQELRATQQDVRVAQSVEKAALGALQEGKAKSLRIKGILYDFKEVRGKEVVCEGLGGQEISAPLSEIKIKELARLAEIGLKPLDGKERLQILIFYVYTGMQREARLELANLERSGVDVPDRLKERYELLRGGWDPAQKEARATQCLMRLRAHFQDRSWEDVRRELDNLDALEETSAVRQASEEIERIRAETDPHVPGRVKRGRDRGRNTGMDRKITDRIKITDDVPARDPK